MPNIIKDQNGTHPLVFKRIDASETKIRGIEVNKRFFLPSGSNQFHGNPFDEESDFMDLFANYEDELLVIDPFNGEAYKFKSPEIRDDLKRNVNGMYAFSVYNSINHLFYKHKNNALYTHGMTVPAEKSTKILFQSASVFSIPQKKMGLKCKPSSFFFSGSVNLHSDKYENLIDSAIDISNFAREPVYYEGFNEYFDRKRITKYQTSAAGIDFIPGVFSSGFNYGLAAKFNGGQYLQTSDIDAKFDRDHDYAISFWISGSHGGGPHDELIISKTLQPDIYEYPFKIELVTDHGIQFGVSAKKDLKLETKSTTKIKTNAKWKHVVCQKTGSTLELYINSIQEDSSQQDWLKSTDELSFKTASAVISNTHPIKIGGYTNNRHNLNSAIDELRIFNHALTQQEIKSLANSDTTNQNGANILQTNRVGNAFHNNGFFVITSADPQYNDVLSSPYTASYQSTVHVFEFSTLCKIDMGDFNMTTNSTALKDDNETYLTRVTSSAFEPYITTVGLYNEHAQLLAIGKLANPLKNRNDVDMNILVRCDLDQDRFAKIKDNNELD